MPVKNLLKIGEDARLSGRLVETTVLFHSFPPAFPHRFRSSRALLPVAFPQFPQGLIKRLLT